MAQILVDKSGYLTAIAFQGELEGGIEVETEFGDYESMGAIRCYRYEDGALLLDQARWAEIEEERRNPPPTADERLSALEALYLESILGGGL